MGPVTAVCSLIKRASQKKAKIQKFGQKLRLELVRARHVALNHEYETHAATRGSSSIVSLFNQRAVVTSYTYACVEISMVVSHEVVTSVPDLAPRDDFRHKGLHE